MSCFKKPNPRKKQLNGASGEICLASPASMSDGRMHGGPLVRAY
jgi:hypothetical protein